jgi:putative DNA primase/helicase
MRIRLLLCTSEFVMCKGGVQRGQPFVLGTGAQRPVRVKGGSHYRVKGETPCPGDVMLASYHTGYYLTHFPQKCGSLRFPLSFGKISENRRKTKMKLTRHNGRSGKHGTYFLDGHFVPDKEYCMKRLPVAYQPDAPAPTRWLQFVEELLYPEDVLTLQEYMGYCLLPVTKGQKMLLIIGKGGEGKSCIGLVLRALLGNNMNNGCILKLEISKFARADLEYKLVMVDDMVMKKLAETHIIKNIVTTEDKTDLETKGKQSVQGTLYVRFVCFENGSLHALNDQSDGFYRRQLLLTTKDKPEGRVDNPYLGDELKKENEGILLWALEGLNRLLANDYRFTISERTAENLKVAMEQGNNILSFLKSEGYFEIMPGKSCKSVDFYTVYQRWCQDNLEDSVARASFVHYLKENSKQIGIIYDAKCVENCRGFHNVDLHPFTPTNNPCPWDK